MVRHLRFCQNLEPLDGGKVGDEQVAGVPDRFAVVRCAGVGDADQVGETEVGQHAERFTVGQHIEVAANDYQILRAADPAHEIGEPFGLAAPGRGVGFAERVTQPVHLHDPYRPVSDTIDGLHREGNTWTVGHRPLDVVGEVTVNKGGVDADDRQIFTDQGRHAEVLPVAAASVVVHRAGVARHEECLMLWQDTAYVIQESGPLWQASLSVGEPGPAGQAGSSRYLL